MININSVIVTAIATLWLIGEIYHSVPRGYNNLCILVTLNKELSTLLPPTVYISQVQPTLGSRLDEVCFFRCLTQNV